jgi:hypothetical protein
VVPHDSVWAVARGTVVLDFTADRTTGVQGLLSKDAKGYGDGGHLLVWLEDGKILARLQDRQANHLVHSAANAIRAGVATRIALVFGQEGMQLYLNGKPVGTNPYAGGLQGNEEPLVIGARDWLSAPRAADKPDAFFAGTVRTVALFDAPLGAAAVAALGPAGSAVAQVATAAPPMPPPATFIGEPIQVQIGETVTLDIRPQDLPTDDIQAVLLRELERQQATAPPIQIRSGASLALQPRRDEVAAFLMLNERAKQAAGSTDPGEVHAALFVELVKVAFKAQKSNEELRALEWWARVVKIKRAQAAEGAIRAYEDWRLGVTAPRTARVGVLLGDDKVNLPSYESLLASGFERVSRPATAAANQSWPKVERRLQSASMDLQRRATDDDTKAILDGVVTILSLLKDGFTGWTTVAATGYTIASARWDQVRAAEDLPGRLQGFLAFARATTPSLTESLYTEEGAKQAYVALIETTL